MSTGNSKREIKHFRFGRQSPDPVLHTETPDGHFDIVLNMCVRR